MVDYAVRLKRELGHGRGSFGLGHRVRQRRHGLHRFRTGPQGGRYEGETSMFITRNRPSGVPGWRTPSSRPSRLTADNGPRSPVLQTPRQLLFDGKSLAGWKKTKFGGEAEVIVRNGQMILQTGADMTGVTWNRDKPPPDGTTRCPGRDAVEGHDFFCGLTFRVGKAPCSLILGGWGGGVWGLSSIDGFDASENDPTGYHEFQNGRWYRVRLRVTRQRITGWIEAKRSSTSNSRDARSASVARSTSHNPSDSRPGPNHRSGPQSGVSEPSPTRRKPRKRRPTPNEPRPRAGCPFIGWTPSFGPRAPEGPPRGRPVPAFLNNPGKTQMPPRATKSSQQPQQSLVGVYRFLFTTPGFPGGFPAVVPSRQEQKTRKTSRPGILVGFRGVFC
ncbi:MAG: hypothetical protein Ct9H300mP1_27690 [Planctomycetaceae bacterium]|nr:MAG: hypothetical protein Ct9H300mP1_27690 [Planctomycetaceae bacterium]